MDNQIVRYTDAVFVRTQRLVIEINLNGTCAIIRNKNNDKIGSIITRGFHDNVIDFILSTRSYSGKGYMLEALNATLKGLFEYIPGLLVKNVVLKDNEISKKFHKSFGFNETENNANFYYTMDKTLFEQTQQMRSEKIAGYIAREEQGFQFSKYTSINGPQIE